MNARIQQALLGLLLLVLVFAAGLFCAGSTSLAAGLAAFVLLIHPAALLLEFVLMRSVNAARDRSPPTRRAWWSAWWGEVRSATRIFGWQQPFRHAVWPDQLPARPRAPTAPRRGVLLVHGYACNRGFWNRWLQRLTEQQIPFVAVTLEPPWASIADYGGSLQEAVEALQQATGLAPLVVAHSMGGLAVRHWWQQPGNLDRLYHLITLGTPHQGTWLARFGRGANVRQMRRGSSFVGALAQAQAAGHAQRSICFYSDCDNIVFPALTASWEGADNRLLPATAHVAMVDHPASWQCLLDVLAASEADLPAP